MLLTLTLGSNGFHTVIVYNRHSEPLVSSLIIKMAYSIRALEIETEKLDQEPSVDHLVFLQLNFKK